jgi:hypothetical protein
MKRILSGSTNARDDLEFLMVQSADHITGATGLAPTVTLRKAGGSFAAPAGAVSEIANGWYRVAANATDNNTTGALILHATGAGADPTDKEFQVVAHDNVSTATPSVGTATSVSGAVGSVTGNVGGNVVGSVASVTNDVGITQAGADRVWSTTTRALTDKIGFALSAAGNLAIWDVASSLLTTVGSIGKRIVDFLTGDSFTRLGAPAGASIAADVAAIQSDTDNIQTRLPAALVGGRIDASVGAMANDVITAAATNADFATEVVTAIFARSFGANYGNRTFDEIMKILASESAGKASGMATSTNVFRSLGDTHDVITATTDVDGNRTVVTLNP